MVGQLLASHWSLLMYILFWMVEENQAKRRQKVKEGRGKDWWELYYKCGKTFSHKQRQRDRGWKSKTVCKRKREINRIKRDAWKRERMILYLYVEYFVMFIFLFLHTVKVWCKKKNALRLKCMQISSFSCHLCLEWLVIHVVAEKWMHLWKTKKIACFCHNRIHRGLFNQ